ATMTLDHNVIQRNLNGGIGNVSGTATSTADTVIDNQGSPGVFTIGNGIGNMTVNAAFPATMTVSGDTISGNTSSEGGGIDNRAYNVSLTGTRLVVINSTISGNTANGQGGVGTFGGGIDALAATALVNDTIVNNTAVGSSSLGGGVYV